MEGGNALADILFGDVCPSGKLPYTVAKKEGDYPYFKSDIERIEYEYYHGYTKMDKEETEVYYPFGYGLSYTSFEIGEPTVQTFADTCKIGVAIKNTGDCQGAEVLQLYVGCEGSAVDRAVKVLKDFARVELNAGEEKYINLSVKKSDMAYYDEKKDDFVEEDITYIAYVGTSSAQKDLMQVTFKF